MPKSKKNVIEEAIKASAEAVENIISAENKDSLEDESPNIDESVVAQSLSHEVKNESEEVPVKKTRGRKPGLVGADGEVMKSINISMPASDVKKLRLLAVEFDMTIKDVVIKMTRERFIEVFNDKSMFE